MRLPISSAVVMAGLVMSQSELAIAQGRKDILDPDAAASPTTANIPAATQVGQSTSTPQIAWDFASARSDSRNSVNGEMFLINYQDAGDSDTSAITWTAVGQEATQNVNVTGIGLCKISNSTCELLWTKLSPQSSASWTDSDYLYIPEDLDNSAVSGSGGASSVWSQTGKIAINIDSTIFADVYKQQQLNAQALAIQMNWINRQSPSVGGISYTPFFAIYNSEQTRQEASRNLETTKTQAGTIQLFEKYPEPADSVTDINNPASSPTDDGSSSRNAGGGDSSEDTGASSSSGRSSGLSTAAIAGIAAGCGAAVIIAAVILLWLCIRRRRRNAAIRATKTDGMDHVHDGYDSTPANHEYMPDKETQPRVTESPHSPYSDNVDVAAGAGAAAAAAGAAGPSHDRSYTPYGDPPTPIQQHASLRRSLNAPSPVQSVGSSAPAAPGHDIGAPRVGSTTPHGLSRSVAALVEDGMTEDEIRRLEEEERALDAAIEQAERTR